MKNLSALKVILSNGELLNTTAIAQIKGGRGGSTKKLNSRANSNPVGSNNSTVPSDDKRRPRPGGGASTQ